MPRKRTDTKKIVSHSLPIIVSILVVVIVSYLVASSLTEMLFVEKLDETHAIALRCSLNSLPFEAKETISNVTFERFLLLNVTFPTRTCCIFSNNISSEDIGYIGVVEKAGQGFLSIWPQDAEENKEYIVYGIFLNMCEYETNNSISVLLVQDYHEPTLLEEFAWTNRPLVAALAILSWALVGTSLLLLLAVTIYIF